MSKDRMESKFYSVAPFVELHYLEKGEGKPIVFIPGLTFSGEIFKAQIEYFASKYRVIAIDPRGQGFSAKPVDGNDYQTHGKDLAALIDGLGLSDVVLVGWSTGNLDAWSYVEQFGTGKLSAVVTIDMSARTPYWVCKALFCDAIFSNYLPTAKSLGSSFHSLMFIAEHWADVAKPFVEREMPGCRTNVMGGHLMFFEYPEKWNAVLENLLNEIL